MEREAFSPLTFFYFGEIWKEGIFMKNNIVVFDTESKARKTCEWLNNFMDEQETGVHFQVVEKDGKYIIAVSCF